MRPAHAVVSVVLLATVLGATVFREELAAAAPPGILNVFVTNDVRAPVPVSHVGPADVNVTNGALAVTAAGEPFQASLQWLFTGPPFAEASVAVPPGKRLRVELVTMHDLNNTPGIQSFSMQTTAGGVQTRHYLSSSPQASNGDVTTASIQAYADGGTTIRFNIQLDQSLGGGGFTVAMHGSVSGVLLDLP